MTDQKKGFEFLEHTADVYIAASGENLAEAFENAALAMFETMTDTRDVHPKVEETIETEGQDKLALLYSWLEELLLQFELKGFLYSQFKIQGIKRFKEGFRLRAQVYGERFDSTRHIQKVGVKAVTYHRMIVQEESEGATVKFILDI